MPKSVTKEGKHPNGQTRNKECHIFNIFSYEFYKEMELCRDVRPIHRSAYGTVPENKKVFYEGSLTIFYDWTICNAKHIENEA